MNNLDAPNRPLVMVAPSAKESLENRHDPWEDRLDKFKLYKVSEHMGYSFDEFLALPRHRVEMIVDKLRKEQEKIKELADKAAEEHRKKEAENRGRRH